MTTLTTNVDPTIQAWPCQACEYVGPLDTFFSKETKDYACPQCGGYPKDLPAITLTMKDGKVLKFYVPTPKQVAMHICPTRNLLWGGRAGTGKSWALRHDAYMRCMACPNYSVLFLRRQFTELQGTHLDKAFYEAPQIGANYRASERKVVFPNRSRVRFGHCETDADVQQYLSEEYDCIYFDEGATFTEYAVKFICFRLRTSNGGIPMVRIGSNPGAMWLYDYYIAKEVDREKDEVYDPADYEFIPAEAGDNPHVNEKEYLLRLNGLPSEALRRMYRDGDWMAVEGQFFSEWTPRKRDPETGKLTPWHVIGELPEVNGVPIDRVPWIRVIPVIDWGYDPDPCAIVWYAIMQNGRIIAIKERTYKRTIVPVVAKKAVEESKGFKIAYRIGGHDMWMSDKQVGESMQETFARNGFSMQMADTDRVNGWARVHTLLTETVYEGDTEVPRFQVYGPGCPNLVRTFPMMQCDPKNIGDILERDDHWIDTTRWMAMSRSGMSKQAGTTWKDKLDPQLRKKLYGPRGRMQLGDESAVRRTYA